MCLRIGVERPAHVKPKLGKKDSTYPILWRPVQQKDGKLVTSEWSIFLSWSTIILLFNCVLAALHVAFVGVCLVWRMIQYRCTFKCRQQSNPVDQKLYTSKDRKDTDFHPRIPWGSWLVYSSVECLSPQDYKLQVLEGSKFVGCKGGKSFVCWLWHRPNRAKTAVFRVHEFRSLTGWHLGNEAIPFTIVQALIQPDR